MNKYKNIIALGIFFLGILSLYIGWSVSSSHSGDLGILGFLLGIITINIKIQFVRKNGKNFFATFGSYSAAVSNVLCLIQVFYNFF